MSASVGGYPYKHHADPQTVTIPFQVPSRGPCTVTATVHPIHDPAAYGQGLLGIYPSPDTVAGFPVIQASIVATTAAPAAANASNNGHRPATKGYATLYGWIQMTRTSKSSSTPLPAASSAASPWRVDLYPPFEELDNPFTIWGSLPTMVDCPARNPAKVPHCDWAAHTWLVYSPDCVGAERQVVPVLGLEWGFWIDDGRVSVKQLRVLDVARWDDGLEMLRERFKTWRFESATAEQGGGEGLRQNQ